MALKYPVRPGSRVTLYFSLALENGELIDSNFDTRPATFRLGDGNMLPGFEECLLDLEPGDEIEKVLPPEKAFGARNPDNVHRLGRERFNRFLEDEFEALETGAVVSFKDPGGFDLPGVVQEKSSQSVLVDFNHPLAGKSIRFRARVVTVIPDDTDPVKVQV